MSANEKLNALLAKVKHLSERAITARDSTSSSPSSSQRSTTLLLSPGKRNRMSEREGDEEFLSEATKDEKGLTITRLSEQPPNIKNGEMRQYQLAGLNWLIRLYEMHLSGILADEMGLGKTLQTISLLAYLRQYCNIFGHYLVVVPKSTVRNWMIEFGRWCPEINAIKLDGDKEDRRKIIKSTIRHKDFDVLILSYEIAIIEKTALKKIRWKYLIVDEAHRLKNDKSLLSIILRTFHSENRLLITGTPLQNNIHELWSLLNFLLPDVFASAEDFESFFDFSDTKAQNSMVSQLHKLLRPFLLRRLKCDVEKDLPPKTEILLYVGMSKLQKRVYKSILMREIDSLNGSTTQKTRLLNIVMQLRKASNHPYLFDGIEDRDLDPFGEHLIENSGKLVILDKLLTKLRKQNSRVLIFSQMTRQLDILEDFCTIRDHKFCRIDGSTSGDDRQDQMDSFNAPNSEEFLFLLSTRAGGLGINLATADTVILYDSDWNPQVDLQAQDRAHRIGQTKKVFVYRFVTQDSVEEKVIERAELKLKLDALVIQQGRMSHSNALSKDAMLSMIRYGADKIFRSEETTITDEDIDILVDRGVKKTEEMNAKLQKYVKRSEQIGFSLDSTNYQILDGVDYSDITLAKRDKRIAEYELLQTLHESMGKRERKSRTHLSYDVDVYFRKALQLPPKKVVHRGPKTRRLPVLHDFQFYNRKRLYQLHEKEVMFAGKYQFEKPPDGLTALTEEEEQERTKLLEEGFSSWNRRDFYAFVKLCKLFGRDSVDSIKGEIPGKTAKEVCEYHKAFWANSSNIEDLDRYVKNIERGETKLLREREFIEIVRLKVAKYENPMYELIIKIPTQKGKGFTLEEDRFLLCEIDRIGYGNWDVLKRSIRRNVRFRFDYFFKSRTSPELNRRIDVLIRLIQKEGEAPKQNGIRKVNLSARSTPSGSPTHHSNVDSSTATDSSPKPSKSSLNPMEIVDDGDIDSEESSNIAGRKRKVLVKSNISNSSTKKSKSSVDVLKDSNDIPIGKREVQITYHEEKN
uniref:ISWI chromatin-remodeling complex ATPase CHR11 n=2 Tax=Hirondellea gigas TaxID=1518452 RepID=A0A6A7G0I3_9CRUS